MFSTGPAAKACFFLYSGESLLSSGFGAWLFIKAAPGVAAGFRGDAVLGLDRETRALGDRAEFWPFAAGGRSVLCRGRDPDVGLSRASGDDREGKLMTCSRNGAE
jgi:hypothetical protein